jgi:hypothetical protein
MQLFQQVLRRLRPTRALPVRAYHAATTLIIIVAYVLILAFHNHVASAVHSVLSGHYSDLVRA